MHQTAFDVPSVREEHQGSMDGKFWRVAPYVGVHLSVDRSGVEKRVIQVKLNDLSVEWSFETSFDAPLV